MNKHLSEIISYILEPLAHAAKGDEIDSTGGLIEKIESLNKRLNKGEVDTVDEMCHVITRIEAEEEDGGKKTFSRDLKLKRIERLREMRERGTVVPNMKAKLWATRLVDQLEGKKDGIIIREKEMEKCYLPPKQKKREDGYSIVGTDVKALFPSLKDVECARMARYAMMESDLKFENVDYLRALRYIRIVGGVDYMVENGLKHLIPVWKGKKGWLLKVGGEKAKDDGLWKNTNKQLTEKDKKKILSHVVEIGVIVAMSTHLYTFGGETFIQSSGGPIGMRSTASLASVIMKGWDVAWRKLMDREDIIMDMVVRYVDDCRVFLPALNEGWYWDGGSFQFDWERRRKDLEGDTTDEERTVNEITKAMCTLSSFLEFTGESASMFENKRLPTLDIEIWWENSQVCFSFYEKPQVPNRVLLKGTALPITTVRASLVQEIVRRMKNCGESVTVQERGRILSTFSQKLVNSGHSIKSSRIMVVHGVTKYLELKRIHNLPKSHNDYKPMYLSKEYDQEKRQLKKQMEKMTWYSDGGTGVKWRDKLRGMWEGDKPVQRKVKGMDFTSVVQVANTEGSILLNSLAKKEPKIAKITGYNVKIVERSGIKLIRLFNRTTSPDKCNWDNCSVCMEGGKRCKQQNVVYKAECQECMNKRTETDKETGRKKRKERDDNVKEEKKKEGIYIGETGRCLFERSHEHIQGLERGDRENFIIKHWALTHAECENPPKIKFSVVKNHRDCLSRLIHEAVLIEYEGSMNSKAEWRRNTKARLVVEKETWEKKKQETKEREKEREEDDKIEKVLEIIEKENQKKKNLNKVNSKRIDSGEKAQCVRKKAEKRQREEEERGGDCKEEVITDKNSNKRTKMENRSEEDSTEEKKIVEERMKENEEENIIINKNKRKMEDGEEEGVKESIRNKRIVLDWWQKDQVQSSVKHSNNKIKRKKKYTGNRNEQGLKQITLYEMMRKGESDSTGVKNNNHHRAAGGRNIVASNGNTDSVGVTNGLNDHHKDDGGRTTAGGRNIVAGNGNTDSVGVTNGLNDHHKAAGGRNTVGCHNQIEGTELTNDSIGSAEGAIVWSFVLLDTL